jgi:hypothetical protein
VAVLSALFRYHYETRGFTIMDIKIIDLTQLEEWETKQMIHTAIAAYTGEKCRYCEHVYESVEDIRERKVVFAGPCMLACKDCFDKNNPE